VVAVIYTSDPVVVWCEGGGTLLPIGGKGVPWHVGATLPDGRRVCVDYREPIARAVRRYLGGGARRAEAAAEVGAWLDVPRNAAQSEMCAEGLTPRRPAGWCGHD
jgi:hypothetical protein